MNATPRQILGVGPAADAREAKRAYRKLAMRWHPDRNSDPAATARFQEIQSAYRRLLAELESPSVPPRRGPAKPPRRRRPRQNAFAERVDAGVWEQFPLAALVILAAGFWALAQLPGVAGWGVFSVALLLAGAAYKPGVSASALRAEFFFKAALRTYFLALLAWAVWGMARKNWEMLALTF